MFGSSALDPSRIRDLSPDALDADGRLRILPAEFWAQTTPEERAVFGNRHAIYSFPTVELVEHLREMIGGRKAIEIGAGNGVLARTLDIPATDNKMQDMAKYRLLYQATGQPTVKYGRNVLKFDAYTAVRRYEPDVVIACWVTHKWEAARHWAGGNEIGVDEEDVLANTQEYIFIGNTEVHSGKKIWDLPHTVTHLPFIYSRATNGTPDFLATWNGAK